MRRGPCGVDDIFSLYIGETCLHALRTFKLVMLMVVDASGGELLYFAAAEEPEDRQLST
jgi:hypothetical protein